MSSYPPRSGDTVVADSDTLYFPDENGNLFAFALSELVDTVNFPFPTSSHQILASDSHWRDINRVQIAADGDPAVNKPYLYGHHNDDGGNALQRRELWRLAGH